MHENAVPKPIVIPARCDKISVAFAAAVWYNNAVESLQIMFAITDRGRFGVD